MIECDRLTACYFYVSEAFVVKPCHKLVFSLSAQDENIRLEWVFVIYRTMVYVNVWHIHPSVVIDAFAVFEPYYRSFFSGYLDAGHSGHISGKVEYIRRVVHFLKRFCRYCFYDTNRLYLLGYDVLRRYSSVTSFLPFRIVKICCIPAFLFQAGVIMFRCIDAVEDQGPRRSLPVSFGADYFCSAVFVGNSQVHAKSGAVTPRCAVKVPDCFWLMVVPAIPQQYANRVFTFLKLVGHIISHIEIPSVETGIQRV